MPASRVVAVLAWALAVLLAVTVTSWAVTVIGGERGPARDRVLDPSDVTAALAGQSVVPSATQTPAASPSPAAIPAPEPSSTAAQPPAAPPAQPPAAPSPATPSAGLSEVARTWSVAGGQVGAGCRGAALSLLYATPVDGWTVQVKRAASDRFEVTFRRDQSETTVHATCVLGVPTTETAGD